VIEIVPTASQLRVPRKGRDRRAARRQSLAGIVTLVLAASTVGGVGAIPARPSPPAAPLETEALARAQKIRAEVTAGYRHAPGRNLAVTEATPTGIVESVTLITDWVESWRVVATNNGIYFAICDAGARCPYPVRSAAWPAEASTPRRMALELALRTFVETSANLVVVALPTVRPVWIVFERDDLLATMDARTAIQQLASNPGVAGSTLQEVVNQLTRPRMFVPLPILPPPDDTIYAVRLVAD
jgi:hypothetical protein